MRSIRPVLFALLAALVVAAPLTHVVAAGAAGVAGPSSPNGSPVQSPTTAAPLGGAGPGPITGLSDGGALIVVNETNSSNYLAIEDSSVQQEGYSRSSLNVAGAIQQDVTGLHNEYASLTFAQRYDNASGQQARTAVVREEVSRLADRVQQLELRRNRAIGAHNDGDLTTEQFLRELAAIDAEARGIETQFDRMRRVAGLSLPSAVNTKMQNLEGDLLSLRGPIRQQVAGAMSGDREAVPVYAVTSASGIVLSSMADSRFHREAYLGTNRNQVGRDKFVTGGDPGGVSTANSRATELYPWVYDNIRSGPAVDTIGNTSIYFVRLTHPHGSLDAFLDGRSEQPFREFQTKNMDELPTEQTANTSDGVRLQVNRTHGTGPMQVSVVDNATGDRLNATVRVNGDVVGTTGADGQLWTLTPQRAVRIQVTTQDGITVRERFFAN